MCRDTLVRTSCVAVGVFRVTCIACVLVGSRFFFQAEDGIRDLVRSRGLGDVYKRQGQGSPGAGGGAAGDLLVTIHIAPHPWFRRDGHNSVSYTHLTLPTSDLV